MDKIVDYISVDRAKVVSAQRLQANVSPDSPVTGCVLQLHSEDVEKSKQLARGLLWLNSLRMFRASALVCGDFIAILMSTGCGYLMTSIFRSSILNTSTPIETSSSDLVSAMFLIPGFLILWLSWSWGHYTRFRPTWTEFQEILKIIAYVFVADIVVLFVFKNVFSRLWIGFFVINLVLLMPTMRHLTRSLLIWLGYWTKSTYVVGTGANAELTAAALESDIALGHRVDGFINLGESSSMSNEIMGRPVLNGFPNNLLNEKHHNEKPCLVFAFDSLSEMNLHRAVVNKYLAESPYATISPPISGLPLYGSEVLTVFKQDAVLLKLQNRINNPRARIIKRIFDFLFSSLLLAAASPIMLAIFFLIRSDGHSATYGHVRIGRSGKMFSCLKFRSMVVNGDQVLEKHLSQNAVARAEWEASRKLTNDPRVTRIGSILRKSSLDELPQLWNVLKGEMSLVGPRPIVAEEVIQYGDHISSYLSMTPGITGLWQTSGRSDTTYRERVLLDIWYARNWSLWHDVVILLRTVPSLLKQAGAR